MQITGRPATFSPWNSQLDSCPLSSPIRTAWGACCFTADAMASGVDSVRPRHTILPTSSVTQIDVSFSDTSRPTYCLLWDMVSLLWRCGEASLYGQSLPRDYAMSRPRTCGASRAGAVKDGLLATAARRRAASLTAPSTALGWLGRERRAIGQHPMHDDGELARERHFGFVQAGPPGDPHRPAFQIRASLDRLGEDDVGAFVERGAHRAVAGLGDAAAAVGFPGLIPARRQAEMGADGFRRLEPRRVVDGGGVGERHDGADTRRRHQKPRPGVTARQGAQPPLEAVELAPQRGTHGQHRSCDHLQARMAGDELLDARF